jgi:DNA replication protein DnaC
VLRLVLLFGAPGVGKTHLAIALGRAVVEAGHTVLFTSARALLPALAKAETEGQLTDRRIEDIVLAVPGASRCAAL